MSNDPVPGQATGTEDRQGARYFARQLSDLDFNDRLLDLVAEGDLPLLERVKFLILFSERIDEFFQVQVAGLRRQVVAGITSRALNGGHSREAPGRRPGVPRAHGASRGDAAARHLAPALTADGIELCDWDDLGARDRTYLHEVFDRLILPVVTPLTVDPSHPFPYISNLSLNIGVEVRSRRTRRHASPGSRSRPNVDRLLPLPGR